MVISLLPRQRNSWSHLREVHRKGDLLLTAHPSTPDHFRSIPYRYHFLNLSKPPKNEDSLAMFLSPSRLSGLQLNMKHYLQLRQIEDDVSEPHNTEGDEIFGRRKNDWVRKCIFTLLGILGAAICLILGYMIHPKDQLLSTTFNASAPMSELHCGNSSTEARKLGCVFDLLTNNWMPEYCSDPLTDGEYREWVLDSDRQLGAWAFYHDEEAQQKISSEEELSNMVGHHVWTTTENHLAHCTFLARRMHRLVTGEIDAVAHNTFAHTLHCTSSILEAIGAPETHIMKSHIGSTFDVGIVSCLV